MPQKFEISIGNDFASVPASSVSGPFGMQLVFRMRICLRRAAHISANRYANGYDMNTDVDVGDKSVYIYRPSAPEISVNQQVLDESTVTNENASESTGGP
jgi:hypothetical protein